MADNVAPLNEPQAYTSNYRYMIAFVAFFTQVAMSFTLGSLGPLGPYLREGLGMDFHQFGLLFTMANFGTMIMLWVSGPLVDKFGIRKVLIVGQGLMGLLMIVGSQVGAAWQLIALEFFIGLTQSVAGPTGSKMVVTWFKQGRGAAMGLKQAGIPMNIVIAGVIFPVLASLYGWRMTFNILCGILWCSAFASALLYRDSDVLKSMTGSHHISLKEVAKDVFTRDQIFLGVGCMFCMGTQFAVSSYTVSFLSELWVSGGMAQEIARASAGYIISLAAAAGILGRLVFGWISDKYNAPKWVLMVMNACGIVVLLVFAFMSQALNATAYTVLMFIYGFTCYAFSGVQLVFATMLSVMRAAAAAVSFTLSLGFLGMMIAPPIFGYAKDVTGGWTAGWLVLAILTAIGVVLIGPVRQPVREK
jgi:MFS family permease